MTNKEAIDVLESQIRAYPDDTDFDKLRNALSHAIEVMKASEWRRCTNDNQCAPKDGRHFLVRGWYDEKRKQYDWATGYWSDYSNAYKKCSPFDDETIIDFYYIEMPKEGE